MYKRIPDREIKHPNGSVTKYNLEIAGPSEKSIERIVVSDSPRNQGPPVRFCEVEVGKQVAKITKQDLKDVKMFVEQADGKYLDRTFREYDSGYRTFVEVNQADRQGRLYTRKEVDGFLERAEIPHERRLSLDNLADDARRYDLSKEHFSEQHRPIKVENER